MKRNIWVKHTHGLVYGLGMFGKHGGSVPKSINRIYVDRVDVFKKDERYYEVRIGLTVCPCI